jgi:hypothetical protein
MHQLFFKFYHEWPDVAIFCAGTPVVALTLVGESDSFSAEANFFNSGMGKLPGKALWDFQRTQFT